MTNQETQSSQSAAARLAGGAYLFMVLGGILYWVAIGSRLEVAGDAAATARNALAREPLFRLGVVYQLFMSLNLMAFALTHHILLKPTGKVLASVGRWLVLADAFLVASIGLLEFIALHVLKARLSLANVRPEQLDDLVGLYLNVRIAGHTIGAVFMHLGGVVFYYLFSKSKLIPRSLATFGIVAYALVLTGAIVNVVVPGAPANMLTLQDTFNAVCVIPSMVLEVVAGGWLLTKGVAARALDSGTFADRGLIEAEQR